MHSKVETAASSGNGAEALSGQATDVRIFLIQFQDGAAG